MKVYLFLHFLCVLQSWTASVFKFSNHVNNFWEYVVFFIPFGFIIKSFGNEIRYNSGQTTTMHLQSTIGYELQDFNHSLIIKIRSLNTSNVLFIISWLIVAINLLINSARNLEGKLEVLSFVSRRKNLKIE